MNVEWEGPVAEELWRQKAQLVGNIFDFGCTNESNPHSQMILKNKEFWILAIIWDKQINIPFSTRWCSWTRRLEISKHKENSSQIPAALASLQLLLLSRSLYLASLALGARISLSLARISAFLAVLAALSCSSSLLTLSGIGTKYCCWRIQCS